MDIKLVELFLKRMHPEYQKYPRAARTYYSAKLRELT